MSSPGPPPQGDINKGPTLIAATCVVDGVTAIAVALRFFVRIRITKALGWDDWTILFAIVSPSLFIPESLPIHRISHN